MRRRFVNKLISSILIVGILMVSGSVALAADENKAKDWADFVSKGNFSTSDIDKSYIATFGGENSDAPAELKKKLQSIENSGESDENKEKQKIEAIRAAGQKEYTKKRVEDMSSVIKTGADTTTAGTALSGLEQLVQVIVGFLCYAITLGMTLFTALDLCYITMPVFRNKCEEVKQSGTGGGALTKTNNKTGETQVRFITDEAIYAVQSCSIESGKQPLTVYLKQRIWAFVMLAIVLFILFTGNIQLIVNIAINFVSGVMSALASLGG